MSGFFPSHWPIMCAVMNQVSDLRLALAITEAGGLASLYVDRYDQQGNLQPDLVNQTLSEFKAVTGHCQLVLGLDEYDILHPGMMQILLHYRPSHVEFLSNQQHGSNAWYDPKFLICLTRLKIHTKIPCRVVDQWNLNSHADALCIKGKDSAGCTGDLSVSDLFDILKAKYQTVPLIPYGGIGSPAQVRQYMDRGAAGVAVGTMFAASQESCLSQQAKWAICHNSSGQIRQLTGTKQNAIILTDQTDLPIDPTDWNREHSLKRGILGDGHQGHLYVGKSIDQVSEILPVKEIMHYLTGDLT